MKTFHKREKRHWLVIEACFPQLNPPGCGYEQRFLYKRFIRNIVVVVVVVVAVGHGCWGRCCSLECCGRCSFVVYVVIMAILAMTFELLLLLL